MMFSHVGPELKNSNQSSCALAAQSDKNILETIFPGNSEMAIRMRNFDWSSSDLGLGLPQSWPDNLRIALSICLSSKFPMNIWWGPKLTLFYNDAYISFLGKNKHPAALGNSGYKAWSEVWDIISPMIENVIQYGAANWDEDILMFIDRHTPKEEVYVTFSFSPIFGKSKVEGMFCACTETTEILIGNRRLETLRKLGIQVVKAQNINEFCQKSIDILAENSHDIPCAAMYIIDQATQRATLKACYGFGHTSELPEAVNLLETIDSPWPFHLVMLQKQPISMLLADANIILHSEQWPEPIQDAFILPIHTSTQEQLAGMLIVGVSPRRVLDDQYKLFFTLVTGPIGTAIANIQAYETERKRAEQLAELDRAKTTFFSNISHEFRTPLTLMLTPLEDAITSHSDDKKLLSYLDIAHRNALRLLKLVNTLLDFSRIEAGRIQACYEPIDLSALTNDLASNFRSTIERAGLTYCVNCEALSEPIYIDKDMWEKIILNLISNAFKFTFEGTITVNLIQENNHIKLSVQDTGTGIAAKDLPHIFERFYRVENTQSRTYEGSGIGLAFVRELVNLHGGNIKVSSQFNRGTIFTIEIPLGYTHLPFDRIKQGPLLSSTYINTQAFIEETSRWLPATKHNPMNEEIQQNATGPQSEFQEAIILIVDDNADMRAYLTQLLSTRWTVKLAKHGQEALTMLTANHFDLIVSDIMMPILDGINLLRIVRSDNKLKTIPFILLSARAGEEARVQGLEMGADDYLIKPFSAREIVARIETHLKVAARSKLMLEHAALQHLHEVSLKLISKDELSTLLQTLVDAVLVVSNASICNVQLYDGNHQTQTISASENVDASSLDHFNNINYIAITDDILYLKKRIIIDDFAQSDYYTIEDKRMLLKAGIVAVQITPLISRDGKPLGTLTAYWNTSYHADPNMLKILDLLAHEAADLIEHRQREDALRCAKEEAEKANQAKDIFLATLSHELRTPLSVILLWAQMLKQQHTDPNQIAKGIRTIEESALMQDQLINDLLDISKISLGKLSIEFQATNVIEVLFKTIDSLLPSADKKSITLKRNIEVKLIYVYSDPSRLKQIFWNILANAIKFTPNYGTIEISAYLLNDKVVIKFTDTGKGIKPEFLPHIFDRFSQADASMARIHGGLGLGLALVRSLLELHGGNIHAISAGENQGSTFTLSLPVLTSAFNYENPADIILLRDVYSIEKLPVVSSTLNGIKILFIDDQIQTRIAISNALSSLGGQVQLAASAREAIALFTELKPDIIISDIAMPEEDGYCLIRKIRIIEQKLGWYTPAIALTAHANQETFKLALVAGFQYCLTKPFHITELVQLVNNQVMK